MTRERELRPHVRHGRLFCVGDCGGLPGANAAPEVELPRNIERQRVRGDAVHLRPESRREELVAATLRARTETGARKGVRTGDRRSGLGLLQPRPRGVQGRVCDECFGDQRVESRVVELSVPRLVGVSLPQRGTELRGELEGQLGVRAGSGSGAAHDHQERE